MSFFLRRRGARAASDGEEPEARALLSQALTYPLSLAAHATTLNLGSEASIAIVGARAEAALSTAV